jgi:hypothetical protein
MKNQSTMNTIKNLLKNRSSPRPELVLYGRANKRSKLKETGRKQRPRDLRDDNDDEDTVAQVVLVVRSRERSTAGIQWFCCKIKIIHTKNVNHHQQRSIQGTRTRTKKCSRKKQQRIRLSHTECYQNYQ